MVQLGPRFLLKKKIPYKPARYSLKKKKAQPGPPIVPKNPGLRSFYEKNCDPNFDLYFFLLYPGNTNFF